MNDVLHWKWPDLPDQRIGQGLERLFRERDRQSTASLAGWKIAANDVGMRARWEIDHCLFGHIPTGSIRHGDAEFDIADFVCAAVEPELWIRIDRDLCGEESAAELAAAIGAVGLAAEIIDVSGRIDSLPDVLAGNVFHAGLTLSRQSTGSRAIDASICLTASRNGHAVWHLPAMTLLPGLETIVGFVAGALRKTGERLDAGQIILSGVLTPLPIWVMPGDEVTLDLGDIAALKLGFPGAPAC